MSLPVSERLIVASTSNNSIPNLDDGPSRNEEEAVRTERLTEPSVTKVMSRNWSFKSTRPMDGSGEPWDSSVGARAAAGGDLESNKSVTRNGSRRQEDNFDSWSRDGDDLPYETEELHAIDCSLFVGWADVPAECLEASILPTDGPTVEVIFGGSMGGGTAAPDETNAPDETYAPDESFETQVSSTESETDAPLADAIGPPVSYPTPQEETATDVPDSWDKLPDSPTGSNGLSLQLSMGIIHLGDLSDRDANLIVTMCLRAMTDTLNLYSPFVVADSLDPPPGDTNNDDRRGLSAGRRGINNDPLNGKNTYGRSLENTPVANLFLNDVQIAESDLMQEWFVLTATYAAYFPNGQPIESDALLGEITDACDSVMSVAMSRGDYWTALESLHYGQDLLMDGPPYDEDDGGLADCQAVGNEYDLTPFVIGVGGDSEMGSTNGTLASDEPTFGPVDGPSWNATPEPTYDTVLGYSAGDVVWMTREWVGLGMMSATLMFCFVSSLIAVRLERTRKRDQVWGILTEEGVGELLHVGWRYHQGTTSNDDKVGAAPQLFLQIFDKAKLGYSDENSMLQGGVEQHGVGFLGEDGLHPISSTAATSTPPTSAIPPPTPNDARFVSPRANHR
jgi:hypothetical protein